MSSFIQNTELLPDLVKDLGRGKIQLPDFQREWVWDEEKVKNLLVSIRHSFPIGVIMLLQTGNPQVKFKTRLLEGINLTLEAHPDQLILDGQQRLTALFQSLACKGPVTIKNSRNREVRKLFYFDIQKSLDDQVGLEQFIVIIPENGILKLEGKKINIKDMNREYELGLFPAWNMLDHAEWRGKYNDYWKHQDSKRILFDTFESKVIENFKRYKIPLIQLQKENSRVAICRIFESVNTNSLSLNSFNLLTATYAIEDFSLRDDWEKRQQEFQNQKYKILQRVDASDFLRAIALCSTYKNNSEITMGKIKYHVKCSNDQILDMPLKDYKDSSDQVTDAFINAAKLLHTMYIYDQRDLPYRNQFAALAAIIAVLGKEYERSEVKDKLKQWYWCGVFGELYSGSSEHRMVQDMISVPVWTLGEESSSIPNTILDANFSKNRLESLSSKTSAAFKGITALLLKAGCEDFSSGVAINDQRYFEESIDMHHVFPIAWCKEKSIDKRKFDSIVNKTLISSKTNKMIGAKAPKDYLLGKSAKDSSFGMKNNKPNIQRILGTHLISDETSLLLNDFDSFFTRRLNHLFNKIQDAMGKKFDNTSIEDVEETDRINFDDF